jgi:hypothetical protein
MMDKDLTVHCVDGSNVVTALTPESRTVLIEAFDERTSATYRFSFLECKTVTWRFSDCNVGDRDLDNLTEGILEAGTVEAHRRFIVGFADDTELEIVCKTCSTQRLSA